MRALRDEYWNINFEMLQPRAAEIVEKDRARMAEIVKALAELGADMGLRPRDLPSEII